MELTPVFDMRKLTDEELETVQTIIDRYTEQGYKPDGPWWHKMYHMCKVTTMERQGYECN